MESAEQPIQSEVLTRDDALKLLESKERWKRDAALAWLEQNKATARDAILERLREESAKRKKKQRRVYWIFGAYGAILVSFLVIWFIMGVVTGVWRDFPWQLFQAFSYMGIAGSVGMATQFQKNAAQVIAKFDEKRFVPDLIDALSYNDKDSKAVAIDALSNLLPRLTASDSELLSTDHRKSLYAYLAASTKFPALTKSILKGMEQVGDERDLSHVRKLAESSTANSREWEVVQAAIECLPFVEQRAESNRAASTLLRASASTPDSELLRPAGDELQTDPATLLRPTQSADSVLMSLDMESVESNVLPLRAEKT